MNSLSLFRYQWSRLTSSFQRLCIVLICVGVTLFVAGLVGDVYQFWARFSFLTNFYSGLTGACFGIPFAIVIVSGMTSQSVEIRERHGALGALEAALVEFRSATTPFINYGALSVPMNVRTDLREATKRVVRTERTIRQGDGGAEGAERARSAYRTLDDEVARVQDAMLEQTGHGKRSSVETEWAALVNSWEFLDDHVRLRLIEADLEFLHSRERAEIRRFFTGKGPEVVELLFLHNKTEASLLRNDLANLSGAEDPLRESSAIDRSWPGRMGKVQQDLRRLDGLLGEIANIAATCEHAAGRARNNAPPNG